jgi:hypothetical protein
MEVLLRKSIDGVGHQTHRLKLLFESVQAIFLEELFGRHLGKPKTHSESVLAKPLSDRKCTFA